MRGLGPIDVRCRICWKRDTCANCAVNATDDAVLTDTGFRPERNDRLATLLHRADHSWYKLGDRRMDRHGPLEVTI